jgi:hypothetical protein
MASGIREAAAYSGSVKCEKKIRRVSERAITRT